MPRYSPPTRQGYRRGQRFPRARDAERPGDTIQRTPLRRELDLRPGGHEILHGRFASGAETLFEAIYYEIIPNALLVFAYDLHVNEQHLSVSLATIELEARGAKETRLLFTEQIVFLNGEDGTPSRRQGTQAHLDRLGRLLA